MPPEILPNPKLLVSMALLLLLFVVSSMVDGGTFSHFYLNQFSNPVNFA